MLQGIHPNIEVARPWPPDIRAQVSACLISPQLIDPQIMRSLEGFGEIIVGEGTHGVYGRYEAIQRAKFEIVYTQDDDCVVDIPALMQGWDGHFVSNMKASRAAEYARNVTLIGWGAMFQKSLADILVRYTQRWGRDPLFIRECDRVFTGLNTHKNVFVDVENLPNAHEGRLGNDPKHWEYLAQIRQRIVALGGRP
jgi:hypothetical protein